MFAILFACVCLLLALAILYFIIAMRAKPHPSTSVQIAKGAHWFWGHLSVLTIEQPHGYHVKTSKEFNGQSYANLLPLPPKVFVSIAPNPLNSEWVLKGNFDNYEKGTLFQTFDELFGKGIFAVDGAEWARKRKLASHMFSLRTLRDHMMNVFDRHAREVVRELRIKVEDGQGEVDMQRVFFDFTAKTFLEIGFGAKDVEGDGKGSESAFLQFTRKFDRVQFLMAKRFTNPLWRVARRFRAVFSSREREIESLITSLNEFAYACVADRRREIQTGRHPDLLSRWLQDAETRGDTLSDEYLRDVVMNFMIAGRDTTACCLTWVLYELCSRPTVLAKVLAEIKSTEGLESPYERVKKMTYTEAVLFESMRLHPPVPSDSKMCMHDDVLPDGTQIPAGVFVSYRPYLWGRSECLWGPDVLEFKPDRWLGESKEGEADGKHSQYKYITFNAGRRLCLGKSLAMLEARLMLMHLLPAFECELRDCVAGEEPQYVRSLILLVQDGLKVNLTSR